MISAIDQNISAYREAWELLFKSRPPVVRQIGDRGVMITSEHGSHFLKRDQFKARVDDMKYWAGEA